MNLLYRLALCMTITLTAPHAFAKPKMCHSCMPSYMDVLQCNEYKCYPTQSPNGGCKNVDCNKKPPAESKTSPIKK